MLRSAIYASGADTSRSELRLALAARRNATRRKTERPRPHRDV